MYSACCCGRMRTAGHDGLRGSDSKHCGALCGAMTRRSIPIQVLTILPSLPFGSFAGLLGGRQPAGQNGVGFLVRLTSAVSSSRPAPVQGTRAAAVKTGRRPPAQPARSGFDGCEHGARLDRVGAGALMVSPAPPGGDRFPRKPASPRRSARSSPPGLARPPSSAGGPGCRAARRWRDRCAHGHCA